MRGSIILYQTAASYLSGKHSFAAMALATTSSSAGSFCRSAAPDGAAATISAASSSALTDAKAFFEVGDGFIARNLRGLGGFAVAVFELAGFQPALAHDDPVRNADQLGFRELHSGAHVAVVEQYFHAGGGELVVQLF